MNHIFLGLGTNLGNRLDNLQRAVDGLGRDVHVTAVSPVYETEPWGMTDQPAFFNACLAANTRLTPIQLLQFIKNLEIELGRLPAEKWGPRLIDIDLLLYDDFVLYDDALVVPHPYMLERAFVLRPLADIAPQFIHPLAQKHIAELVTAVDATTVHPIGESLRIPVTP